MMNMSSFAAADAVPHMCAIRSSGACASFIVSHRPHIDNTHVARSLPESNHGRWRADASRVTESL